jgi:hypothetical protein
VNEVNVGPYFDSSSPHHLPAVVFYRHTYIEQERGESINDRNDRAIRVAAKWYHDHLQDAFPAAEDAKVILLTNDAGNLQQAKALGLTAYTGEWGSLLTKSLSHNGQKMKRAPSNLCNPFLILCSARIRAKVCGSA